MARPGLLGRIQIEARADTEIVALAIPRQEHATRTCVRGDEHEAKLASDALSTPLDHERLFGTGQSGKVVEDRYRGGAGRRAYRQLISIVDLDACL